MLELRARKESSEIGWMEKAAEEMDIILDDFDVEKEDDGSSSQKHELAKRMKGIKAKKDELNKLLKSPIFPRGFSYKYPTASGQLAIPLMGLSTSNNAVTVMKDALKEDALLKGQLLKDYKNKSFRRPHAPSKKVVDKAKKEKPQRRQKGE